MEDKTITAVAIDGSKGKGVVAVRRPGGKVVLMLFQAEHDAAGLSGLVKTDSMKIANYVLSFCTELQDYFMDRKRAVRRHFYVYTVAGAARFLRTLLYFGT